MNELGRLRIVLSSDEPHPASSHSSQGSERGLFIEETTADELAFEPALVESVIEDVLHEASTIGAGHRSGAGLRSEPSVWTPSLPTSFAMISTAIEGPAITMLEPEPSLGLEAGVLISRALSSAGAALDPCAYWYEPVSAD